MTQGSAKPLLWFHIEIMHGMARGGEKVIKIYLPGTLCIESPFNVILKEELMLVSDYIGPLYSGHLFPG